MPKIGEILDTLKKMKYSAPKPLLCPKCGGYQIKIIKNYGILPNTYSCIECGYEGSIIIELEKETDTDDGSQ